MPELRYGSPTEAGMLPERVERVRELAAGWVKSGYSPAIGFLVARRGVIVLHEALGVLGPEDEAPTLELDSVFPVTSVNKSLTAALVMSLVEDGLIGLNRPIQDYIPEFAGEWKDEILIHHLLTHSWGENVEEFMQVLARQAAEGTSAPCPATQDPGVHQLLQAIYATPLAARPGTLMRYATLGYVVLGELVRRVSGRRYEDVLQERILDPLEMNDSYMIVPESVAPRVVRRSPDAAFGSPNMMGVALGSPEQQASPNPAGGLLSTTRDIAVYAQTFLNGGRYGSSRVLSPASVEAMMRNQIPGIPFAFGFGETMGDASMGYGWFIDSPVKWRPMGSLQSLGSINHMGVGASIVWADPARELVGVYLEVLMNMTEDFEALWNFDLFQNAVTAAVAD